MNAFKSFSFKKAYKFSANSTIDNFGTLIKLSLLWIAIFVGFISTFGALICLPCLSLIRNLPFTPAINTLPTIFKSCAQSWSFLPLTLTGITAFTLFSFLLNLFEFQLFRLAKAYYEERTITIAELFTLKGAKFFKYWAARALFGLKVMIGLILFIIPGFYTIYMLIPGICIMYTYCFSGYSILDGTTDKIGEDARISARLTDHVKWRMFFAALLIVVFFIGSRGLYLLVASPMAMFPLFSIYKQLKEQSSPQQPKKELP